MGEHPNFGNGLAAVDFERRLEIRINNTKPLALGELTASLTAVGDQFSRFISESMPEGVDASAQLLVREVRAGSMVFELVAHSLPYVPLIWEGGALNAWVTQFSATLQWLSGQIGDRPRDLSKQDLRRISSIVRPIAQDNGSQMNLVVSDGGTIVQNFNLSSSQAAKIEKRAADELLALDEPNGHVRTKQLMTWYQARFDDSSDTGSKAIIEAISSKPVKVTFENAEVRRQMMHGAPRINRPWQELAYLVDVEVQTIAGVPKLYTVRAFHPEETFDPND